MQLVSVIFIRWTNVWTTGARTIRYDKHKKKRTNIFAADTAWVALSEFGEGYCEIRIPSYYCHQYFLLLSFRRSARDRTRYFLALKNLGDLWLFSFPCFQVLASPLGGKYGGLFRSTWCIKKVHCNLLSGIRISSMKGHEILANMELECGEYYPGRRDTSKSLFRLYVVINYQLIM